MRREAQTSKFDIDSEADGTWNERYVTPGDTRWVQFFSDRTFQEGEIIWMDIGSCCYNFGVTDDVEVQSIIDFKWFLRQVLVRPTGV